MYRRWPAATPGIFFSLSVVRGLQFYPKTLQFILRLSMNYSSQNLLIDQPEYSERTADYYLQQIDVDVHNSLTPEQLAAVRMALEPPTLKPCPKIVDLRVNIDLIVSRFYIVLFVGKDRRKSQRPYTASGFSIIANRIAVITMLVGLNLTISLFIFFVAYLIKSALGFNLLSSHLSDYLGH